MAKEYKPGQFVSICGKLHRVKEAELGKDTTCMQCPYDKSPYIGKKIACDECIDNLSYKQYPIPLKPKHQG